MAVSPDVKGIPCFSSFSLRDHWCPCATHAVSKVVIAVSHAAVHSSVPCWQRLHQPLQLTLLQATARLRVTKHVKRKQEIIVIHIYKLSQDFWPQ